MQEPSLVLAIRFCFHSLLGMLAWAPTSELPPPPVQTALEQLPSLCRHRLLADLLRLGQSMRYQWPWSNSSKDDCPGVM